jgi:tetratricopeptide (TPR) repeat protein
LTVPIQLVDIGERAEDAIDPAAIRDAVLVIQRSPAFIASRQLCSFLAYIVDKALAGEGDRIKAYSIATEALGRPDTFDPASDPIVRVEAGRLRRALAAYYEGEGAEAPIRIDIPRGSYVPRFDTHTAIEGAALPAAMPPPGRAETSLWWIAVGAAVLLAMAVLTALLMHPASPQLAASFGEAPPPAIVATRPVAPRIYVYPFTIPAGPSSVALSGDKFGSEITAAMAAFDEVSIAANPNGDADYIVKGTLYEGTSGVAASVMLVYRTTGRVIWSGQFQAPHELADTSKATDLLVRDITTAIAQSYGVVMADRMSRTGPGDDGFACVLSMFDYWRQMNAANHASVRPCLEDLTRRYPTYGLPFALLAILYSDEARFGFNPQSNPPAVERAMQAAGMAVALAPQSARAHQALAYAYSTAGRFTEALESSRRAQELNPFDTDITADYGRQLVIAGQYARGAEFIELAIRNTSAYPDWYDLYLALAAFEAKDPAGLAKYLARANTESHSLLMVLRLIEAKESGTPLQIAAAQAALQTHFPALAKDPQALLLKLLPNPVLVQSLVKAMQR